MAKKDGLTVAVVGVTGAVGEEILRVLDDRRVAMSALVPIASARSAGSPVTFRGREWPIKTLSPGVFRGVHVALFSAGASVSKEWCPRAAEEGALVVDNSSAFRMDPAVPLVVPEVNASEIGKHRLIANPNCSTIMLVVPLYPITLRWPVRRVVAATYQAVSGAGRKGLVELESQVAQAARGEAVVPIAFPNPILGNVFPHESALREDGANLEEWKVIEETKRILGRHDLHVAVSCTRVPVPRAHSEAVLIEADAPMPPEAVREALMRAPGVRLAESDAPEHVPTPRRASGGDDVLVGRVRRAFPDGRSVWLWLCGDQLRKGAALNAVQIAEIALGLEAATGAAELAGSASP